jgi:hypothetical protein
VIWLLESVGFLRKAAYEPDSVDRLRCAGTSTLP